MLMGVLVEQLWGSVIANGKMPPLRVQAVNGHARRFRAVAQ